MTKISIYQVFTRLFGNKTTDTKYNGWLKQNGTGKFNDFNDTALQAIKKLGVTHIWYTGIIEHATCEEFSKHGLKAQNPLVVKGKAGSPYAITDYFDVNAYLAEDIANRMQEFEDLISRTHKNGLKAIIDFVPNHVARQYGSDVKPEADFGLNDDTSTAFSPQNNYYYIPGEPLHVAQGMGTNVGDLLQEPLKEYPAKATGNDQFHAYPSINDWYETVKLNYGVDYQGGMHKHFNPVPPLWNQMYEILDFWCSKNVDGIRCDMAEMVPVEFWEFIIKKIKAKYPKIIFIAEVYDPNQYHSYINTGGFDYLYDKVGLYDCLRAVISQDAPAHDITNCWQALGGIDAHMLKFLENHDEHRIAAPQFAGNAFYALPAMFVSATISTGPIMTYFGQEVGEPAYGEVGYSGDDGKTTIFDFYKVPEHQKWMNGGKFDGQLLSEEQKELRTTYEKLLNFCISSKAIAKGSFYDLMWVNHFEGGPDTRFIFAFLRYEKEEKLLVVVNFNKYEKQLFRLRIPGDAQNILGIKEQSSIDLIDQFSAYKKEGILVETLENGGVGLELEPLQSCVFSIT